METRRADGGAAVATNHNHGLKTVGDTHLSLQRQTDQNAPDSFRLRYKPILRGGSIR